MITIVLRGPITEEWPVIDFLRPHPVAGLVAVLLVSDQDMKHELR